MRQLRRPASFIQFAVATLPIRWIMSGLDAALGRAGRRNSPANSYHYTGGHAAQQKPLVLIRLCIHGAEGTGPWMDNLTEHQG
jgi:hypothetical protein